MYKLNFQTNKFDYYESIFEVDGGFVNSVYLLTQSVDGGGA